MYSKNSRKKLLLLFYIQLLQLQLNDYERIVLSRKSDSMLSKHGERQLNFACVTDII